MSEDRFRAALDVLHALVLEDGRRWGAVATAEQRADVQAILDEPDRPYNWLGRSRGYSKTTDLAGVGLALLLCQAPPGSRSYAVAADQGQAGLLLDALAGFVRRDPALAHLVEVQATKVIVRSTGATLETLPADQSSAWGLKPYFCVVDELVEWGQTRGPRRIFDAVMTAMPKTGGRLVVASAAGDPAHFSAKVREHALAEDSWRVSETVGPAPWIDERLLAEQRRRLPDSLYQRLFLNVWSSGEDRLVTEEDLRACVVLDGPVEPVSGLTYSIGVDVGTRNDRTAACVCHQENGVVTLDRIRVWEGTRMRPVKLDDVERWLYDTSQRYRGGILIDPTQAVQLSQRLRARRLDVVELPFTEQVNTVLASTLLTQLRERALRLPDDPELIDELLNVRLLSRSDGKLRIDHDSGKHDDRVVALALAVHRLLSRGDRDAGMLVSCSSPAKFRIDGGGSRRGRAGVMSDVAAAKLAALYGTNSGEPSWFARRRALARTTREAALDARLGELGIPTRATDGSAGRAELDDLIDRADGRR